MIKQQLRHRAVPLRQHGFLVGLGKAVNGFVYRTQTDMSRWTFSKARPVNLSSPIRDLIHVFSLPRDKKLRSALAVLTGKVNSMAKNVLIKGNIGHGTGTAAGQETSLHQK